MGLSRYNQRLISLKRHVLSFDKLSNSDDKTVVLLVFSSFYFWEFSQFNVRKHMINVNLYCTGLYH